MRLKEEELRCLNWNEWDESYGMSFGDIHKRRLECFNGIDCPLDGKNWQMLYIVYGQYSWIKLSAYERNYIYQWLCSIEHDYETCGAWRYLDWDPCKER